MDLSQVLRPQFSTKAGQLGGLESPAAAASSTNPLAIPVPTSIQTAVPSGAARPGDATSIADLTRRIVRGEEAAFEEFYAQFSGRLYRFLLVLTRGREDFARELHQVVFIKVARKFRVLESETELWAWLTQIARNACIDALRKEFRIVRTSNAAFENRPPLPAEPALDHELEPHLERAVANLPIDERELIQAVYFAAQPQKQVAAARGQTLKAVESKLARIRAKLKAWILEELKL